MVCVYFCKILMSSSIGKILYWKVKSRVQVVNNQELKLSCSDFDLCGETPVRLWPFFTDVWFKQISICLLQTLSFRVMSEVLGWAWEMTLSLTTFPWLTGVGFTDSYNLDLFFQRNPPLLTAFWEPLQPATLAPLIPTPAPLSYPNSKPWGWPVPRIMVILMTDTWRWLKHIKTSTLCWMNYWHLKYLLKLHFAKS